MSDKSVIVRTFDLKSKRKGETEKQWIERLMKKNPRSSSSEIIDESELPQSKEDRSAWEGEKGKGITINTVKANAFRTEKSNQEMIQNEMKAVAIESLKGKGKLPTDYEL